ncbi:MAG TPA: hypothetical protein VKA46_11245 [Gemmataceae bacterium]|nr:hypothetical protein [Gemmataceae bacterium]
MVAMAETLDLTVEDFTGQVRRRARGIPRDATVGDLVGGLTRELHLPANDSQGRPLSYSARARGEGLLESDRIGDVLETEDVVTLAPNVTAG